MSSGITNILQAAFSYIILANIVYKLKLWVEKSCVGVSEVRGFGVQHYLTQTFFLLLETLFIMFIVKVLFESKIRLYTNLVYKVFSNSFISGFQASMY